MPGHYWGRKLNDTSRRTVKDAKIYFWGRVQMGEYDEDCWSWPGPGKEWFIYCEGKRVPVIHFIYKQVNGPIPEGGIVSHTCGNDHCVNPSHMKMVLRTDDLTIPRPEEGKRQGAYGPTRRRFTPDQVLEIRSLHRQGMSITQLTKKYDACDVTIRSIVKGKTWKWLEG